MKHVLYSIVLILICSLSTTVLKGQSRFTDVTQQAGIDHQFMVFDGLFGGGACVLDINNDGFEDLYITSGLAEDQLYQNNGDGTFTNVFQNAGLNNTNDYVTQGVASADFNKDGWMDLFITTINTSDSSQSIPRAKNLLFLNKGNGTFTDATSEYNLDHLNSFSTGVSIGDINIDGYPDIYVGNYFLAYEGNLSAINLNDAAIVNSNQTSKGYLLINQKGTSFRDEYESYGLNHRGFGFGAIFTDFDNDRDLDLFVHHDFGYKATEDVMLRNEFPKTSFSYVEKEKGMDLRINSMGTAVGDINHDGYFDYFITNIRMNRMMVSQGKDQPYKDMLKELGMAYITISWGANFEDFDHDGDLDLFVANGDLNPNCVPMANFYFENENGTFKSNARAVGVNDYGLSRGSVVFDMENDGDLDILVVNQNPVLEYPVESRTILYRNDSTNGNWLKVALKGNESDMQGIGARITVVSKNGRMTREVYGGSSHISQSSTITHFGLGDATTVDSLIVNWVGGKEQVLTHQAVNVQIPIVEIKSEKKATSLLLPGIIGGVVAIVIVMTLARRRNKKPSVG